MVQAADFSNLDHLSALWRLHGTWLRRVLVQGQVRPRSVIITQELANNASEVIFTEHDDVVEAVPAQGPDHSLHERRLPGTAWRNYNLLDFEDAIEERFLASE